MPPARVGAVTRGKLFEQLDVADQGGARIAAFQQVMAQNPVFWKFSTHRAFECIHIINAFADERAFSIGMT